MRVADERLTYAVRVLVLGLAGGSVAILLRVPGAWIVGPLVSLILFKLARPSAPRAPTAFREVGKILLGTAVGGTFSRQVLGQLGGLLPLAAAATVLMIGAGVLLAVAVSRLTNLDLSTALFSITPGGMPEMVAMSEEGGADLTTVAALQFLRFVSVLVFAPLIVGLLAG